MSEGGVVDWFQGLDPIVIYAVIAVLSTLESAALTGLVIPGDTALLVAAAVLAETGGSPVVLVAAAAGGAILGDSIGYEIGRLLRRRDHGRLHRIVSSSSWARAESMVARHGALAIVGGRFVAVVRTVVPVAAGSSAMRYRRFLAANASGAVLWATAHVTIGVLAGRSVARAEGASRYVSGAMLALVVALVVIGVWRRRSHAGLKAAEAEPVIDLTAPSPAGAGGAARAAATGGQYGRGGSQVSVSMPAARITA